MHVDERDGPTGRPFRRVHRPCAALVATVIVASAFAGCASKDEGNPKTRNPSSSVTVNIQVFKLGQRANSAKGTVVVYGYDGSVSSSGRASPASGNRFVAIDVEGCAGSNADETTGIGPQFFYLQLKGEPIYPIDPGVREPVLHQTSLAPGRCTRGWVTFEIGVTTKPQYALFRSLSRRAWLLPQ